MMLTIFTVMVLVGTAIGIYANVLEYRREQERRRTLMRWYESNARFLTPREMSEVEKQDRARREARAQREDMKRWHES